MTPASTPAHPAVRAPQDAPPELSHSNRTFEANEADAELFARLLRSFVPPDAFDAHAHLYRVDQQGQNIPAYMIKGPEVAGLSAVRRSQQIWMGDRMPADGVYFPIPYPDMDIAAANRFNQREANAANASRWLMLVRPTDDPAAVERQSRQPGCCGFKVYHCFAAGARSTFSADIHAFVPEWLWEICQKHSLAIMLHLVKRRALADPANQRYLREHCVRYPNAKLILAHAARGFCGRHTVEGIGALRGLDNVFFDTSVVCEPAPIEAILKTFGPTRLMYGSDFPLSELHGRAISLADGFMWLYDNTLDYSAQNSVEAPTLIGIESILAIKQACTNLGLNDRDVEQIFCRTGRELLGIRSRKNDRIGQQLYEEAKTIIPGGAQLFGKRSENFAPRQWPAYFAEARGCETIDLDGNRYTDMSVAGIGATLLGFADPDVTAAVSRRVMLGSMCTLNAPEEVELAKLLIQIHPWAQMARFGRMGGETMAMAVRIARARTRRDHVAFCGYHGWHDWYLAANLSGSDALGGYHLMPGLDPAGVPRALAGTMHAFSYNNLDELKRIVDLHGPQLAAIVMEPARSQPPAAGFLEGVRELADRCGAKLVFDEITIGWRLCLGGAHRKFGIDPDLAVFAKTLGGGHPISAVIGTADVMQAAQDTFISTTMATEAVGPAAGVAAVKKFMRVDVPAHVERIGQRARDGLARIAQQHRIPLMINGYPALSYFGFNHPQAAALQTLWTARMLSHGYLASGAFYPTLAHEDRHIDAYLSACENVFAEMASAIGAGDIEQRIGGPVKQTGFKRLT